MINGQNRGLVYAIYTALFWGFLAIGLKVSVEWLNPVSVLWLRFFVAFIVLQIWMLLKGESSSKIFRKPPFLVFLAAIFLGLNYWGFIEGIAHVSPSNAQVFIQLAPVGFALVGIFVYHEKVNWKSIAGFMIVITGLFIFYLNQIVELKGLEWEYKKGILYVVGGAVSWMLFASFQKALVTKWDANQLNLFIYGFCSLSFLPLVDTSSMVQLSLGQWLLLISLGLNTVLSYGFLALAIKYAEANRVSVIITLNPIITFITMAVIEWMGVTWIEHEHFNFYSIVGAIIALSGAIITILSRKSR
jgi:drug/metabolite transporter (DMT)-like permease